MVAPLLSSCATPIHDFQACSPIPGIGAVCDNFLTKNPQTIDEAQWEELQAQWKVTECISASSLAGLKAEIEKLCSVEACDEETKQLILKGLEKIQFLGTRLP